MQLSLVVADHIQHIYFPCLGFGPGGSRWGPGPSRVPAGGSGGSMSSWSSGLGRVQVVSRSTWGPCPCGIHVQCGPGGFHVGSMSRLGREGDNTHKALPSMSKWVAKGTLGSKVITVVDGVLPGCWVRSAARASWKEFSRHWLSPGLTTELAYLSQMCRMEWREEIPQLLL